MATGITARWYQSDSAIDGTAEATSTIETTLTESEFTRDFYLHGVSVLMTNVSNVFSAARVNIGTNDPNYNNMVANQPLGTATGLLLPLTLASGVGVVTEGTAIKCKVIQAAEALMGSPTCEFNVIVHGHDLIY